MAKNLPERGADKTQEGLVAGGAKSSSPKGKKTILMMGVVIIVSVGCAFVFVSKVYPSLAGNPQLNVVKQENEQTGEAPEIPGTPGTPETQAIKPVEVVKEPVSSKKKEEKPKEGKGAPEEESLIISLDPVVVNLRGSNARRYLKAKVSLEAKDGEIKKKLEAKSIQIKDRLISIFSSKTLEDVEGIEGQENLRREIKDTIDIVLKAESSVLQVYFTEFVVQ